MPWPMAGRLRRWWSGGRVVARQQSVSVRTDAVTDCALELHSCVRSRVKP